MADELAGVTPANDDDGDGTAALGDAGKRALDAERKARREAERRARAAEERLAALERERLRDRIAADRGVPAELLTGSNEDEMTAAADRLLEWRKSAGTGPSRPPRERLAPNPGQVGEPPVDFAAIAERIQ